MQFAASLRNFSLSVATASFLIAGAAFAQSNNDNQNSSQYANQTTRLAGANTRLDHAISTKSATQGQMVAVKLDHTVKTLDGITLPKGTQLMGKVDRVQAAEDGKPAVLTLDFNCAQLKGGKRIPMKVTVLGAYPPSQNSMYGTRTLGPAPKTISSKEQIIQEPGLLHHVQMKSAVHNSNSATFRDKNGNFRLAAGTYFQIGLRPEANNSNTSTGF